MTIPDSTVPPDNQDLFRAGELSIRSILFATDFSPASHASGLYARALSTEFRVPMTVVHAFLPSQSAQEAEETTGRPSAERLGLKAQLDRTAAALSPPHAPAAALLLQGVPSEELQRISEEQAGVLLVLGTHGGSVIGRHFLGSTAESVLSAVSCPTLTVGPHVTDPRQEQLFQHVLYATDCSITGARAAALACAVAFRFGGELRVIGVIDDKEGPAADLLARFDFHMRKELSQTMHDPCTHFAESSKLATATHAKDVILRELAGGENDLLVLGIRQKAFLGFAERNSTAFQIIASASRPVLTITDKALSSR